MELFEQMNRIFCPRSVAIIGASDDPGKAGHDVLANLRKLEFQGSLYPVNPTLSRVQGLPSFSSVQDIPGTVDLAIVAVPARLTPRIMEDCAAKGIHAVVMYTSGFKETEDKSGPELETRLLAIAEAGQIRIVGPNCLGVMNPALRFNGTFIPTLNPIPPGNVAIVAQSGGACHIIANELARGNCGVSKLVSIGNRANLNFHDVIRYLAADEATRVITIYIEGLDCPREFMAAAREAVSCKPVVVYKVGRNEQASRASVSHTGALAGNYEIYKAAFKQCGVIVTDSLAELVDVTKALALLPPAAGDNVAILSASAGAGIVMTDKLEGLGLKLAEFSPETKKKLRKLIPPMNSSENPVDIVGIFPSVDSFREALRLVLADGRVDAVAVGGGTPIITANFNKVLEDLPEACRKPITFNCTSFPIPEVINEVNRLERERHVPAYPFPERSVRALAGLVQYGQVQRKMAGKLWSPTVNI